MKATARNIDRPSSDIAARVDAIDWTQATADLDAQGCAVLKGLLSPDECAALAALYPDDKNFRSRIVMGRHGFGRGEYKYFAYPLPDLIAELRPALYARLCGVANRWNETMGIDIRYPDRHEAFLKRCHDAGQTRPTPLLLQYGEGDYNCLHQDLYGEHVFPLQVAILLSEPGRDFDRRRVRADRAAAADAVAARGGSARRRATRWPLLCITGRCRGRAGPIALICAMASAGSAPATAIPSA